MVPLSSDSASSGVILKVPAALREVWTICSSTIFGCDLGIRLPDQIERLTDRFQGVEDLGFGVGHGLDEEVALLGPAAGVEEIELLVGEDLLEGAGHPFVVIGIGLKPDPRGRGRSGGHGGLELRVPLHGVEGDESCRETPSGSVSGAMSP